MENISMQFIDFNQGQFSPQEVSVESLGERALRDFASQGIESERNLIEIIAGLSGSNGATSPIDLVKFQAKFADHSHQIQFINGVSSKMASGLEKLMSS